MKLPNRFKSFIIGLGLAAAGAVAQAAPVLVQNASFELPDCDTPANCSNSFYSTGPGAIAFWNTTGDTGVFDPTTYGWAGITAKDGDQVAYSNGGTISQTLASLLNANTTYTLKVDVGARKDTQFPGYLIELLAGGNVIETNSFAVGPAPGAWTTLFLTYTATAGDPFLGSALGIRLSSAGPQTEFDNVQLDATAIPEPFTTGLLGLGLLGLAAVRRRSMNK